MLVTDIELGDLEINEETSVSEFTVAVLTLNDDYEDGDQITFFYGVQMVEQGTGVPRAKIKGQKVKLDVSDDTLLWSCVTGLGFTNVDGYLGMNITIENGAAAWVHSREDEQGTLKVSSQKLTVDSSVLQSYMGDAAFEASVQSYGGITNRKVFLRPDDETNTVGGAWYNAGGGSNTGGSTGGNAGGGTTGGETGGNTGGGSDNGSGNGGNPSGEPSGTVTVNAPTFSGETQFETSTTVSMSAESGASIYYTLDGAIPTSASTQYSAPITLTETKTVKAIAIKNGVSSSVTERTYTKMAGNGGGGGEGGGDME